MKAIPVPMQRVFDMAYRYLQDTQEESRYIWDMNVAKRWGASPASDKQLSIIRRRCKGYGTDGLTKIQASMILNRLFAERRA